MTPVVRRLACAALGLAVARIVAGNVPGGRRAAVGFGALAWLSVALVTAIVLRQGGRQQSGAAADSLHSVRADDAVALPARRSAARGSAAAEAIEATESAASEAVAVAEASPEAAAPEPPVPPRRPPTLAVLLARGADF